MPGAKIMLRLCLAAILQLWIGDAWSQVSCLQQNTGVRLAGQLSTSDGNITLNLKSALCVGDTSPPLYQNQAWLRFEPAPGNPESFNAKNVIVTGTLQRRGEQLLILVSDLVDTDSAQRLYRSGHRVSIQYEDPLAGKIRKEQALSTATASVARREPVRKVPQDKHSIKPNSTTNSVTVSIKKPDVIKPPLQPQVANRQQKTRNSTDENQAMDDAEEDPQSAVSDATRHWFPWPIPNPSSQINIRLYSDTQIASGNLTLEDANRFLTGLMNQAGYTNRRYYEIPGAGEFVTDGFVLVTQLEQIDPDANPLPGSDRWVSQVIEASLFDLRNFLKALLTADKGYFRVLAFVVSTRPLEYSAKEASKEEATEWLTGGTDRLQRDVASSPYTTQTELAVLVYEFQHDENHSVAVRRNPPSHSADTHLSSTSMRALLNLP